MKIIFLKLNYEKNDIDIFIKPFIKLKNYKKRLIILK